MNIRALFSFLRQTEVYSFFILLIIAGLLWWFGPIFSNALLSEANRFITVLVLTNIWGISQIWRLHKKTDETLNVSSSAQSDAILIEIKNVRKNFDDALAFLRERLANFGTRKALYTIPWYLVIGPSGGGKTQLLANSELPFLEAQRFVQMTPTGLTTTGSINWWFAPSAILLDIPGNYLQQTNELTPARAGWLELLRLIKHYRRRCPINGVILVVDADTLNNIPKDSQSNILPNLRSRLQEIVHRLKQHFPVYLVCSQLDKIIGFREYFDDLGHTERQQHWGITFPMPTEQKPSISALFQREFDRFLQRLHERVLWRIHQERQLFKRNMIKAFPLQLSYLKDSLMRFIYEISHSATNETNSSLIRGIYFTSALQQEHASIDYLSQNVSKSFALVPAGNQLMTIRQPTPFFIKQLFDKTIFPEAALATENLQGTFINNEDNRMRFIVLSAATLILLSATVTWTNRFRHQTTDLSTATAALADYKLVASQATSDASQQPEDLLPALNALNIADDAARNAKLPWILQFQLHRQQGLGKLVDQLYQRDLQTKFIPAVRTIPAAELRTGNITDPGQLYELLKIYLMLGDPEHADPTTIQQWFNNYWQENNPDPASLEKHLTAALNYPILPQSNDETLVSQIRNNLNALPYPVVSYAILRDEMSQSATRPINSTQSSSSIILPSQDIPNIFYASQLSQVKDHFDNAIQASINGNWVLGNKSTIVSPYMISSVEQSVTDYYIDDYVNAWQNWLNNIQIAHADSLSESETTLEQLANKQSLFWQIFQTISANTNLNNLPLANSTFKQTLQNNLAMHFNALNHFYNTTNPNIAISSKNLRIALQQLQQQIEIINTSANPSQAAYTFAAAHMQNDHQDALSQLINIANQSPPPVKKWMLAVAKNNWQLLLQQANQYVNTQWQQQALPFCQAQINNRYPFDKTATQDISLNNFSYLIQNNGLMNQFFNAYLAPFVDTTQAKWQWKKIDGETFDTDNDQLAQFERASILQKLYFTDNQLQTNFDLQLIGSSPNISSIAVTVGGKTATYLPGDTQQISLSWPTPADENASIVITELDGQKYQFNSTGPWALFKLIDQGQISQLSDLQHYNLNYTTNSGDSMQFQIITHSPLSPFIPGVVDQFKCPPENW